MFKKIGQLIHNVIHLYRFLYREDFTFVKNEFGNFFVVTSNNCDIVLNAKNLELTAPDGLISINSKFQSFAYKMSFSGQMPSDILEQGDDSNLNAFYGVLLRLKEVVREYVILGDIISTKDDLVKTMLGIYMDVAKSCFENLSDVESDFMTFVYEEIIKTKEANELKKESSVSTKTSSVIQFHSVAKE